MSSSRRIRIATGAVLLLGLVLGWRVATHRRAASGIAQLVTAAGSGSSVAAPVDVPASTPTPRRSRWVPVETLKPGESPRFVDARFTNRLRNTDASASALVGRDRALLLRNAFIDTASAEPIRVPAALQTVGPAGAYIVQSRGVIDTAFRERLASVGAEVISYIPNNAFLVSATEAAAQRLANAPETASILPYEPYFKLEPSLLASALDPAASREGTLRLVVTVNDPVGVREELARLGVRELRRERGPFGVLITLDAPAAEVAALARSSSIQLIERWQKPVAANDRSGPILGSTTTPLNDSPFLGLTGKGVLVNLNDSGVDQSHPDLQGRVHAGPGLPAAFLQDADGHGTHVAGIIAGDGSQSGSIALPPQGSVPGASFRGRATAAELFALSVNLDGGADLSDEYLQVTAATNTFRTDDPGEPLISNNSWVYNTFEYGSHSASFDAAVRDAAPGVSGDQPILYVFAAGNNGGGGDNGIGGSGDSINSPGNAKNVITVGALESLRNITNSIIFETNGVALVVGSTVLTDLDTNRTDYTTNAPYTPLTDSAFQVAGFSGRGNVGIGVEGDSGRFKPDLVAPGTFILSARSAKWTVEHDFPTNEFFNDYLLFKDLTAETKPSYRYESGTSMSAASVAGLLAQMQEFFRTQVLGQRPSAAGYKALLINSATVTSPTYVPDPHVQSEDPRNYAGWGEPYLPTALTSQLTISNKPAYLIEADSFGQSVGLATGESRSYKLQLNDFASNAPVRISLVWTDPPGNPIGAAKLVNDLDLVVSNTVTHQVLYGNDFEASEARSHIQETNNLTRFDRINNVERILLPEFGGTNFIVSVVAHRVNVNARRDHTNGVVQDFALVIATDAILDGTNTTAGSIAFLPTSSPGIPNPPGSGRPGVIAVTNGIPFLTERVGANSPLINAVFGGSPEQWQFYAFTNSPGTTTNGDVIMTNGHNVAFLTFPVGELSRARTNDPDIDLYVSLDPGLTNLNPAALGAALKSTSRGGSELIAITNAPLTNEVYYIGVKSEDQQGAEYGLVGVSTDQPFTHLGADGRARVLTIPLRQPIPDGRPNKPGVGLYLGISTLPGTVRGATVVMTATHQNFPDLLGNLSHNRRFAVLNNHSPLRGLTAGTNIVVTYDDTQGGNYPGSVPSDGPGSMVRFMGESGSGAWFLTTTDNAQGNVGRISGFDLRLLPNDFGATFVSRCVNPSAAQLEVIDVPADATGMTITITNMQPALPLEVFIRKDEVPDVTDPASSDKHATIVPPGGEITLGVRDIPALQPGRYYIAVYNPQATQVCYRIRARLERGFDALNVRTYTSRDSQTITDQGRTYAVIPVDDTRGAAVSTVGVRLDHDRKSDLAIRLINPEGAGTVLFENRGGNDHRGLGAELVSSNLGMAHVGFTFDRASGRGVLFVNGHSVAEGLFPDYRPPTTNQFYFGTDPLETNAPLSISEAILLDDFGLWRAPLRADQMQSIFRYGLDGLGKGDSVVRSSKISVWPFDSDGTDSVGANDVVLTSKAAFVTGQIGKALRYVNGVGGQIPVSASTDVGRLPAFSIEGWVGLSTRSNLVIGGWGNTNQGSNGVWGPVLLANYPPPLGNGPGSISVALDKDGAQILKSPKGITLAGALVTNQLYAMFSDTTNFTSQLIKFANPPFVTDPRVRVIEADDFETNAAGVYQPLLLKTILVDGWTINRGAVEQGYNGEVAFNGEGYLALDQAELQKTFKTIPGRVYTAALVTRRGLEATNGTVPVTVEIADVEVPARSILDAGDQWQTNVLTFQAQSTDTGIKIYVPSDAQVRGLIDGFRFVEDGSALFLPEEPMTPLAVATAKGNWLLEINDGRIADAGSVVSWQLGLILTPTNTPAIALTNAVTVTTNIAAGQIRHFIVEVPPEARGATNFLKGVTGAPLNLLFNQTGIPDGTQAGDYSLLNGVTTPEQFAALKPGGTPPLKSGQRYYLGVQNPGSSATAFSIRVDFDVNVRLLTNGIARLGTNAPAGLVDYYAYDVSDNGMQVAFALTNLSGDVNLVARKGPGFPTRTQHDYRSTNSGTNSELIVIDGSSQPVALTSGRWYLGVYSASQPPLVPIAYRISATEVAFPTTLTNGIPLKGKLTNSGAPLYFTVNVTNDPARLSVTLTNLTGNANLFLKKEVPVPTPDRFDYASTNDGNAVEQIIIGTNSTPVALSKGHWIIAVVPVDPTPIQFTLIATLDANLSYTDLTDSLPLSTSWSPGQPNQTYRFVAPAGSTAVLFELYNLTGEADLYGAYGGLPTGNPTDFSSTNPGLTPEVIVLRATTDVPDLGGAYYLEVRFPASNTSRTDYTIRATASSKGTVTGGQPIVPVLGLPPVAGGSLTLTFNSLPGETYRLEHTTNLFGSPVSWAQVGSLIVASGYTTTVPLPNFPVSDSTLQAFRLIQTGVGSTLVKITTLTNETPISATTTADGSVDYYAYDVAAGIAGLRLTVSSLTADVNLAVHPATILPSATIYSYLSANSGLAAEEILIDAGSSPVPLATGRWYAGVFSAGVVPKAAGYTITATEIPYPAAVTNGVVQSGKLTKRGAVDYYYVEVPDGVSQATFTLTNSGNADLYVRGGVPLAGPHAFDAASTNAGTADEVIVLASAGSPVALTPGHWFIGVASAADVPVNYGLTVTFGAAASTGVDATIVPPTTAGGPFTITFNSTVGAVYQIESTDDLFANPVTWSPVGASLTAIATTTSVPITPPAGNPTGLRSYRVRQLVSVPTTITATFELPSTPGGPFNVVFSSTVGAVYQVESTDDLFAATVVWSPVGSALTAISTTTKVAITPPAGNPVGLRSYRVRQLVSVPTGISATFELPTTPGGPFNVVFSSTVGAVYQVESTDDLFAATVVWGPVGPSVTATLTTTKVPVTPPAGNPTGLRSYRVRQVSP